MLKIQSRLAATAILLAGVTAATARASTLDVLYTFQQGADGGFPFSGLVEGPDGSFFGTSAGAGMIAPYGTVFQLFPPAAGVTAWTLTPIYTFSGGSDGQFPAGLIRDTTGVIYGATVNGGTFNAGCGTAAPGDGCGTIFQLTPPAKGHTAWAFKVIHSFTRGRDGAFPRSAPAIGAGGVLYGLAEGGGRCKGEQYGCGVAYSLTPPAAGKTAWTETTLHAFDGAKEGATPEGPPVFDKNGILYGEARQAGIANTANCHVLYGCGTVFALSPPAAGVGAWTFSTLHVFSGPDGSNPRGGLAIDASGDLFGITHNGGRLLTCPAGGGKNSGCGAVFEVIPPATGTTQWTGKLIYAFRDGPDGSRPWDAPILANGALYLTSSGDEVKTDGSIIRLTPPAAGQTTWTEKTLYTFLDDTDSDDPTGPLLLSGGILYGTAGGDGLGPAPAGTIFSLKP